jgi:RNA polymerase sigma-70 factor (ECF subfamily)
MPGDEGDSHDDTLMRRVAEGNAFAFETLVRRNMRRALAVAQGITGNPNDADEIAQEAFMRVWQHAHRWNPGRARFSTWLHRIVVNLCLDRRRKPQWVTLEVAGELCEESSEAAPEQIAQRQHRLAVARAMEGLPERQRAAITLFYFEGLSGNEAAGSMGLTIAAFEQLLLRARRAVKAELASAGIFNVGALL